MIRAELPLVRRGQTVGLLGGSFDPPHQGHVTISLQALKRFNLDQLWWLVSPGNPLKSHQPAPLSERIKAARALITHPRIAVTGIEAELHTRYTAETLRRLQGLRPDVRFVWLMGADNLAQIHLWKDWREIFLSVPVGVMARPGARLAARLGPAARTFETARISGRASSMLARGPAPRWCMINIPMSTMSSTALRAEGRGGAGGKTLPHKAR